jgi:hydrogenase expression/formation protein HypE
VVRDNGLGPGDLVIVTGTVGDHGLAIMAARHDLALEGPLVSDTAPLNSLVRLALEAGGAA